VIARDRAKVSHPSALDGKKSKGATELKDATLFYREQTRARPKTQRKAKRPKGKKSEIKNYEFAAYRDNTVKRSLSDLFDGKCAYCEILYAANQPMDVEHYRPKGEVLLADGTVQRPAYWWLAASWENLLPSCIDCNRERGHEEFLVDNSRRNVKSGKEIKFPIPDERLRVKKPTASTPAALRAESPLLIDPCEANFDPSLHFAFTPDGVVIGRTPRGIASISVYGLNRTELVRMRQYFLRFVQHRLYVLDALGRLLGSRLPAKAKEIVQELIDHECDAIFELRKPDAPFSEMVRQVTDHAISSRYGKGLVALATRIRGRRRS
jgi:uncharacterized protein (TIGR02646 family)